jgi:VWFA-related protein
MTLSALTTLLAFCSCWFFSAAPTPKRASVVDAASQSCEASQQHTILLNLQDKDAQFINGLQSTDLKLSEDGAPRNILKLETVTNAPLAAVILIDNSSTQYFTFTQAKLGAQKFVEWNLKDRRDRAALVSFALEATVEEDLTNDWTKLQRTISQLKLDHPPTYFPGPGAPGRTPPIRARRQGTTAIADAVWASTDGILKSVTNSRRVIVVLTDGEDWASITRLNEAISYAGGNDVAVFAIDMKIEGYGIIGRTALTELAEDTGGRSFGLRKIQNLPEVLQKIDRQARAHYALTYCAAEPSARKQPAKIDIEITNSQFRNSVKRLAYPRYIP